VYNETAVGMKKTPPPTQLSGIFSERERSDSKCGKLVLDEGEEQMIFGLINEIDSVDEETLESPYNLVVIKKQTNGEYSQFQEEVKRINSNKCDCSYVDNLTRKNGWTVYWQKTDCEIDSDCSRIPPDGCTAERIIHRISQLWFPFLFFGLPVLILVIGAIAGIRFIQSRRKR